MRIKTCFLILCVLILKLFGTLSVTCATSLDGNYYGAATIDSPSGLENVDLAFHLEFDTGGVVNATASYILLDKTLLFPAVGQIDGKDVGPMVESGILQVPTFNLVTEAFTNTVSGRTVTRKITLSGNAVSALGDTITGTYSELMTGYLPKPVTVTGTFILVRPTPMAEQPMGCQYLDTTEPIGELSIEEIRAGGRDPNQVEFDDLSCAMHYHQHPELGLLVSDEVVQGAIAEYRVFLATE